MLFVDNPIGPLANDSTALLGYCSHTLSSEPSSAIIMELLLLLLLHSKYSKKCLLCRLSTQWQVPLDSIDILTVSKGCDVNSNDTSGFSAAISAAKQSDIVL